MTIVCNTKERKITFAPKGEKKFLKLLIGSQPIIEGRYLLIYFTTFHHDLNPCSRLHQRHMQVQNTHQGHPVFLFNLIYVFMSNTSD